MYCAALIANSVSEDEKLFELLNSNPSWHYKQLNLHVAPNFPKLAVRAEQEFGRFRIAEIRQLDGLKLIFKDRSWIMFRASGTEPKVRIYCESRDQIRLAELLEVGKKLVEGLSLERIT